MEIIMTIAWLSCYGLFVAGMIQNHFIYKNFLKSLDEANSGYVRELELENERLQKLIGD
jgi:hypothetical protein